MATIFAKGGTENTLILGVRESFLYPFIAPNWTDLRVGFFVSLTDAINDDLTTGLAETINNPGPFDFYFMGVFAGQTREFAGFSNWLGLLNAQVSKLVSSDLAIGTSNAYFWRAQSVTPTDCGGIYTGTDQILVLGDGSQQHYAQDPANAGGYATLLTMRLTRPNPNSNSITFSTKSGTHSGDVLFTNTPTAAVLNNNLQAFPQTVQQLGPYGFSGQLNALYFFWPFHNSRLRIHAVGILQSL
jgi:hypothetical protein